MTTISKWESDFRRRFGSPHCEHLKPGIKTKHIVVHVNIKLQQAYEEGRNAGYLAGIAYQKSRWRRWFRFLP